MQRGVREGIGHKAANLLELEVTTKLASEKAKRVADKVKLDGH